MAKTKIPHKCNYWKYQLYLEKARHGQAGPGEAWHGGARRGKARQGSIKTWNGGKKNENIQSAD